MRKRYSIFVIPRGRGDVKRLEVNRWMVAIVAILLIAGMAGAVGLATDGLFYRNAYLDLQSLFTKNILTDKRIELQKLAESVGRMERLASNLNATLPADSAGPAIGPIEEEDWLPSPQVTGDLLEGQSSWRSPFASVLSPSSTTLTPDELLKRAEGAEEKLAGLMFSLNHAPRFWASLPAVWPVRGYITSGFGDRRKSHIHEGIDIAAPRGTPVHAPGNGIVTFAGYKSGYGKTVVIDHGFGLTTLYGHCSTVFTKEGQAVSRGNIIASVGNTGYSTGPHLHFEIISYGLPVNPLRYIAEDL